MMHQQIAHSTASPATPTSVGRMGTPLNQQQVRFEKVRHVERREHLQSNSARGSATNTPTSLDHHNGEQHDLKQES